MDGALAITQTRVITASCHSTRSSRRVAKGVWPRKTRVNLGRKIMDHLHVYYIIHVQVWLLYQY